MNRIRPIFFSPTGTTRRVVESIAGGFDVKDVVPADLTPPEGAKQTIPIHSDDLAIIGAPVYGGRLPPVAVERFRRLRPRGTLAILVVVYGNREFEDALLELKDLAVELGFTPIAGGAFIGEHSFASNEIPIANGRPDSHDLEVARSLGARAQDRINAHHVSDSEIDLGIPGRFPYEGGARSMRVSPVTKKESCTLCGTCADRCPTAAISIDERVSTDVASCIRCCACIKSCPTGSRVIEDATWISIATWLNENCRARKEPAIFGIGA